MTREEMITEFDREEDWRSLDFENVKNQLHPRRDLCAMLMIEALLGPGTGDFISWAGHDEIAFDVDLEKLAEKADVAFIRDLRCCGVLLMSGGEYLGMYV